MRSMCVRERERGCFVCKLLNVIYKGQKVYLFRVPSRSSAGYILPTFNWLTDLCRAGWEKVWIGPEVLSITDQPIRALDATGLDISFRCWVKVGKRSF